MEIIKKLQVCRRGKFEDVKLAETNHYTTFATRSGYSVLDNGKANELIKIKQRDWRESLQSVIEKVN